MKSTARPSSTRSSESRSSTAACTETSSADVISSQTSERRDPPRAHAPSRRAAARRRTARPGSGPAIARGQAHALEQRSSTSARASSRDRPRSMRGGPGDLVGDAVPRVERVGRVLEDDLDATARSRERAFARGCERLAVEQDPAGRRARAGRRRSARSSSCPIRTRRPARGTRRVPSVNETSSAATTVSWRLPCTACKPSTAQRAPSASRCAVAHGERAARSAIGGVARHSKQRTVVARPRPARAEASSSLAALDPLRAARRERAAGRTLADADRDARDPEQPARRDVIRDRGDQPARVRVARPREQLRGRAVLDDPAGVHDGDPVGDRRHDREVVA